MLYVYRTDMLTTNMEYVMDLDKAFDNLSSYMLECIQNDNEIKNIVQRIDRSTYENGILTTKFGMTTINNCSSGCKAAILIYLYNQKEFVQKFGIRYINASDAGDNAMKVIIEMSLNNDIYIHCNREIPLNHKHGRIVFEGRAVEDFELIGVMYR